MIKFTKSFSYLPDLTRNTMLIKKIVSRTFILVLFLSFFLSGCAFIGLLKQKYEIKEVDATKGIIVGTVFERAVFTPYGAYFYITTPQGEQIILSSGAENASYSIINTPPKLPKGVGNTFALQLPPGKYQVTGWALDYGRINKTSTLPDNPIEFEVEAGKAIYLGRFDANRLMEIASIHDNYTEDSSYLNRIIVLRTIPIENRSINYKGWWLPNAAGKEILKKIK